MINRLHIAVAVSMLLLGACRNETAPTEAAAPPPASPPVAVEAPPPAPVDYATLCRDASGAWSPTRNVCEVTSMLCPSVGTWVDGKGCKTDIAEAECNKSGLVFAAGDCLVRDISTDRMNSMQWSKP